MSIENDVRIISLVMGTVSMLCSSLTLLLIYSMKKYNGYLLLLTTITFAQCMYDINYILRYGTSDAACYVGQFLDLVGGLGAAIWTNVLTFSVTYTIIKCRSIQVFKHYPIFSIAGTAFPLVVGICAMALPVIETDDDDYGCGYRDNHTADTISDIYYWGRLGSVMFTFALCSYNFVRLRSLTRHTDSTLDVRTAKQHDFSNMYTTIYRMNFYAIAQILARSGAAWNEWDYGRYSTNASSVMAAICSPSMGICNFMIFLIMQPQAWANLKAILRLSAPADPNTPQVSRDIAQISSDRSVERSVRIDSSMSDADNEVINRFFVSELHVVSTPSPSISSAEMIYDDAL